MKLEFEIRPPKQWERSKVNNYKNNYFDKIISGFEGDDILFKVIKENGSVKLLDKNQCVNR